MGAEFHLWLAHLQQPEYVHVLLNPIPIYGSALAALCLLIAILIRNRGAMGISLMLVIVVCMSAWLAAEYGEAGYDRVLSMSNADAQEWLKLHAHRAGNLLFIFYVTAAASAASLLAMRFRPEKTTALAVVTLAFTIASAIAAAAIGDAGGQIRHSEFRDGPPPANLLIHDAPEK